jgi:hypothetical protein
MEQKQKVQTPMLKAIKQPQVVMLLTQRADNLKQLLKMLTQKVRILKPKV